MAGDRQEMLDRFYWRHGPCCAGCDWWRSISAMTGECTAAAPVSSAERLAVVGIEGCSLPPACGHPLTPRDHHCGSFRDEFDWTALPLPYRKRIGAPVTA